MANRFFGVGYLWISKLEPNFESLEHQLHPSRAWSSTKSKVSAKAFRTKSHRALTIDRNEVHSQLQASYSGGIIIRFVIVGVVLLIVIPLGFVSTWKKTLDCKVREEQKQQSVEAVVLLVM